MGRNKVVKAADEGLPQVNLLIRTKLWSGAKFGSAIPGGCIRETSLAIDRDGGNGTTYASGTLPVAIDTAALAPRVHLLLT